MTATLPPRAADEPRAPAAPAPGPADPGPPAPPSPILAEVLLALLTAVAVAGFLRLFDRADAVVPLFVAALGAHAVGAVGRRLGWGVALTAGATLVAAILQISIVLYPHTSAFGLPTPATVDLGRADLLDAWDLFGRIEAPAPRSRGFLLAACATLWVAAALADWAAFRLRAVLEAVLPAASVFVFTTLLGRGGGAVALATAMAFALLAFTAAQRASRAAADDTWVGGRARQGGSSQARVGIGLAVLVALGAAVAGPRLPTADDDPIVQWRGDDGPDARTTVSPLVDIRSRLVQQSSSVVFTVQADEPAYWRLTSLPTFDGQVWSSSETFDDADGQLPSEPPEATTSELRQTFSIRSLDTIWAPGALTPVEVVDSSTELRWNSDLATLIVPRDTASTDGAEYTLVSRVPSFRPEDLAARQPAELPEAVAEATVLPDDLPPLVAELAEQAVGGAGLLPYDRALALQTWFRTGFEYDLEGVASGHSGTAIEAFLLARRGYCEQFAGTYAAMARTLGLPARVAVGFTPGDPDPSGDGFTVRGRNAHAWPEVWIAGAGWVPFEPTPGRGQPGTEAYTGVEPAQDEADPLAAPTTTTPGEPTTTLAPDGPATSTPPRADTGEVDTAPPVAPADADQGTGWAGLALAALVLAVAVVVLDAVAIAAVRARRRRATAGDTSVAGRVRRAWTSATEALGRIGLRPRPSETAAEFARRAGESRAGERIALTRLSAAVTAATWAPSGAPLDPGLAEEAERLAGAVTAAVDGDLGWRERLRAALDPRPLLG